MRQKGAVGKVYNIVKYIIQSMAYYENFAKN